GVARGTGGALKAQLGGERVAVGVPEDEDLPTALSIVAGFCGEEVQVDDQVRTLTAAATGGTEVLRRLLARFKEANVRIEDIGLRRPTLDDVFLSLTGHVAEEESPDGEQHKRRELEEVDR